MEHADVHVAVMNQNKGHDTNTVGNYGPKDTCGTQDKDAVKERIAEKEWFVSCYRSVAGTLLRSI